MVHIARPDTLTATAASAIREAIFHGELQPGEALREVELSSSLGVARGTVREALRLLQDEKLVEVFPHRGAFVRRLSPQTAQELYTLRALVEPYAVRLALEAGAYTEEDIELLRMLSLRLNDLEHNAGDMYETTKADVEFHYLICSRSNHQLLLQLLRSLQALTWLFVFNIHLYHSDVYSDEPSHHEIYEAIRSGDPVRAEDTLRKHISAAGRSLLICLEQEGLDSAASQ